MDLKEEQGRYFKALSDPFRLKIIELLPKNKCCEDMFNVNELVGELGGSQPNMSHHLGVLKSAGILKYEKICNSTYFYVDTEKCRGVMEQFMEHYLT